MFALLIIDIPLNGEGWSNTLYNIVNEKQPLVGTSKMSATTYKIDLGLGLHSLCELVDVAKECGFPCHVSFFPDEPFFSNSSNKKD